MRLLLKVGFELIGRTGGLGQKQSTTPSASRQFQAGRRRSRRCRPQTATDPGESRVRAPLHLATAIQGCSWST